MDEQAAGVVTVEILGQRYPIRSDLDGAYIARLASYVDEKMQRAANRTTAGDSVRVAVLTALNIADEYFRYRDARTVTNGDVIKLTTEIEELVDRAVAQATNDARPSPAMSK